MGYFLWVYDHDPLWMKYYAHGNNEWKALEDSNIMREIRA